MDKLTKDLIDGVDFMDIRVILLLIALIISVTLLILLMLYVMKRFKLIISKKDKDNDDIWRESAKNVSRLRIGSACLFVVLVIFLILNYKFKMIEWGIWLLPYSLVLVLLKILGLGFLSGLFLKQHPSFNRHYKSIGINVRGYYKAYDVIQRRDRLF